MGVGSEILAILKDTVKLTDSVERLNDSVNRLAGDMHELDKRVVRLETLVEIASHQVNQSKLESDK